MNQDSLSKLMVDNVKSSIRYGGGYSLKVSVLIAIDDAISFLEYQEREGNKKFLTTKEKLKNIFHNIVNTNCGKEC